jgi:hypothetical protein
MDDSKPGSYVAMNRETNSQCQVRMNLQCRLGMPIQCSCIRLYRRMQPPSIAKAAGTPSESLGYALASQVDGVDGGDRFELRHDLEPAVLTGMISSSNDKAGSEIRGQIEVPGQTFYRSLTGFVCIVGLWGLLNAAWDLLFRTHLLLTRSRTELQPGHPASVEEHWIVFLCIPIVALPILAVARPPLLRRERTRDRT